MDIYAVFPDFDADVNDPTAYDFACTDAYIKTTLDAGTKIFYRLGSKIEHWVKKYNTLPPKDFRKWAQICEHIIMHYNEGWANGYHWNIEYWEIWNEPDLDPDDALNKRTWGGTTTQFYDLYEITAKHLKGRFPSLKIGGPSLAYNEQWGLDFLTEMRNRNVPIDFFSWHIYCPEPAYVTGRAERIRNMLDENGYTDAESILNEWNYIRGWEDDFIYSLEMIHGMKGAAFTMSIMLVSQQSAIDMLMYYDAGMWGSFNGMFDAVTFRPIKGYYPFRMFHTLYQMGTSVECLIDGENVYAVAAKDADGNSSLLLTYYTDDDNAEEKTVHVALNDGADKYELYLLDQDHDCDLIGAVESEFSITLKNTSVLLVKSIQ